MDQGTEMLHITKMNESFLREFIQIYRENRILWDKTHPNYKSRSHRDVAMESLVNKSAQYFPEANLDFVRSKICNIRSTFWREYKKVQESRKKFQNQEDVYAPTLWYYNLLLCITGEDDVKLEPNRSDPIQVSVWSKHYTVLLIELLKSHPLLYSRVPVSAELKCKRLAAYKSIAKDLTAEVGRHFNVHEVKNKINTLKLQFRRELREQQSKTPKKNTKLWCYNLLSFLEESEQNRKEDDTKEDQQASDDEGDILESLSNGVESAVDKKAEELDDLFDTIGKSVALKLRDMSDEQRCYAENLINEIMYNGLMQKLGPCAKISFTGD